MIQSDRRDYIPGENEDNNNPIPRDLEGKGYDEKAHMSRNLEKNTRQSERDHLNPDREKRTGSSLNPDRNSGDR